VIEGYLEKHAKHDEAAETRINDELLTIWLKTVQGYPEKYAPFLALLRPLRPAVRSQNRILQWWDRLSGPVLDHLSQQKGLAKEALASCLSLIVPDSTDETEEQQPSRFADRLFQLWIELSQVKRQGNTNPDPIKANLLRETLLLYGKKQPKVSSAPELRMFPVAD
jgi:hypothetical protein